KPVFECVEESGDKFIAHFGYENASKNTIVLLVGPGNRFSPAPDNRGQLTSFDAGAHHDAVQVPFSSHNLIWILGHEFAQASKSSTRCVDNGICSPTIPGYKEGKCGATTVYKGKLYECISQAAGVEGEKKGCGEKGVYCSNIPPDYPFWGTKAWKLIEDC